MAYTTIDDPSAYFQTKIYTGNNTDGTQITNDGSSNLQPDWLWIKNRTDSGGAPATGGLWDSVRGFAENKVLTTFSTNEEGANSNGFAVATTNGFTVEDGTSGGNPRTATNLNAKNYVAWQWKESATAGFDIVTYTGTGSARTVSHSLSAVPNMMIVKRRDSAGGWITFHSSLGNTKILELHDTGASQSSSSSWNNTSPTSSVFTVGDANAVNANSGTFVAYLFAEKKGYSKFGSYTGNGNADGTFVYTGFLPSWVMIKRTDSASDWYMYDNKRDSINVMSRRLEANQSDDEVNSGSAKMDFVSNGIKFRGTDSAFNVSGASYIYMAFAESPFVTGASAIPTTAR